MISFVQGRVVSASSSGVVIQVGGVGLELVPTARCRAALLPDQDVTVATALVVREDGWTMFAFADDAERRCFTILQQAKGIGPRVALNVLATLSPAQLVTAIAAGDSRTLTAVPGIGAKGAERLVIDLRDKFGPADQASAASVLPPVGGGAPSGWRYEVQQGLVGLGWTAADALAAIARIQPEAEPAGAGCGPGGRPDTGLLLRLALRTLDRTSGA